MRYFSAASNRSKRYLVHPYQMTLAQGGVYLVGWVPQYNEFRTFATERVEHLSIRDERFPKTRVLPADLFVSSLGVFSGEPERTVVEFDARTAVYVRSRQWHASQQLEELPEGGLRVTLHVTQDWALRSWLLGFGAGVRVVAPAPLAKSLAEECAAMARTYRDAADRSSST
jgi:predicted DNA-binding transcriptional regulator YafY